MSARRRPDPGAGLMIAGWLFADLALGLVIILLATATDAPAVPAPAPSPSAAPSPTLSPTPSPTAEIPLGVEQEPIRFLVQSDADALLRGDTAARRQVERAIRDALAEYEQGGRTAAFVLTFGGSGDSGEGVRLAAVANEIFQAAVPDLAGTAATRDFWGSTSADDISRGTLEFEVYLFIGE